jgi:hypothetical protein
MQARAQSGPLQDIPGRIEVAVNRQTAIRALMQLGTKILRNMCSAAGTVLTGVSGIHFDQSRTGPFCLVSQYRSECRPCSIMNIERVPPFRHCGYSHLLYDDDVIIPNQSCCRLAEMVSTLV